MQTILYTTDSHGKASVPTARLDDYPQTVLSKFKWLGEYGDSLVKEGREVILLHGGDILDSPNTSEDFIRKLAKIISSYQFKMFAVIGNHDEYGYNPQTFNRTTLGVTEALNMFYRLSEEPVIVGHAAITGVDSCYDLDKDEHLNLYTKSKRVDGKLNIRVVHGMLLKQRHPKYPSTSLKEVEDMDADVLLTGHDHAGYGLVEKNGKVFCNPGALLRVSCASGDVNRDVRILRIDIEDDDSVGYKATYKLINLPESVAKPHYEVLDDAKLKEEKERREKIDDLIENVEDVQENVAFDIFGALSTMCEKENIDKSVEACCKSYLQQAEEELKQE